MSGLVRIGSKSAKSKAIMTITQTAAKRLQEMMQTQNKNCVGFRLGLKRRGCHGLSYTLDPATHKHPQDEVVEGHGVTVFVDASAVMNIIGTEMDFVSQPISSEFVFTNPNAKSSCGCGESFSTDGPTANQ